MISIQIQLLYFQLSQSQLLEIAAAVVLAAVRRGGCSAPNTVRPALGRGTLG
ncbi:MAG: hypothetical protein LUQ44_06495 [Methanothrix sp.]|nr:hypothetical protein [Methanothrix sp.]